MEMVVYVIIVNAVYVHYESACVPFVVCVAYKWKKNFWGLKRTSTFFFNWKMTGTYIAATRTVQCC